MVDQDRLEGLFELAPHEKQQLNTSLEELSYVVMDMEMTGGDPAKHRILEICAVEYRGGKIQKSYHQLINPRMRIPPIVHCMTGISHRMVAQCPLWHEVLGDFLDFIGSSVLVAHNMTSDLQFLKHYARRLRPPREVQNFFLCTHLLAHELLPESPRKNLQGLCQYLRVPAPSAHRAQVDTEMTLALLLHLLQRLRDRGCCHLEHVLRLQADYDSLMRLGWNIPLRTLQNVPAYCGVFAFYGPRQRLICCGSSENLRRDVGRIARRDDNDMMSRSWHRRILQAQHLEVQTSFHLPEAFFLEQACRDKHGFIKNFGWEFCDMIMLQARWCEHSQRVVLSTGTLYGHPHWVFAPLQGYGQARKLLTLIADRHGLKVIKNKVMVLLQHWPRVQQEVLAWAQQEGLEHTGADEGDTESGWVPPREVAVESLWGVVSVKRDMDQWDMYPIVGGYLQRRERYEGSRLEWLRALYHQDQARNGDDGGRPLWLERLCVGGHTDSSNSNNEESAPLCLGSSSFLSSSSLKVGLWLVMALTHNSFMSSQQRQQWGLEEAYFDRLQTPPVLPSSPIAMKACYDEDEGGDGS